MAITQRPPAADCPLAFIYIRFSSISEVKSLPQFSLPIPAHCTPTCLSPIQIVHMCVRIPNGTQASTWSIAKELTLPKPMSRVCAQAPTP